MPLISDYYEPFGGRVLLWQFTDRESWTEGLLKEANKLLENIQHPVRIQQRLATCAMLLELDPNAVKGLWYDQTGKPWLKSPAGQISISHCDGYAGLYYHPCASIGLDLEKPHPRIEKVAPRFLHPEKEAWAGGDIHQILKVWSAKEAIFKAIGGGGIHFKEDIHVEQPGDNGIGTVHYQGHKGKMTFKAMFKDLESALMVYTIAE